MVPVPLAEWHTLDDEIGRIIAGSFKISSLF